MERCNSSTNLGANGFLNGSSSASDGGGANGIGGSSEIRTYKRRKRGFEGFGELGFGFDKGPCMSSSQSDDNKMVKESTDQRLQNLSCEQVSLPKINCHSLVNGSDDCCYQHWRNVLENMCQSLSPTVGEFGGISSSIRDALNIPHINDINLGKANVDHDHTSHSHRNCGTNGSSTAVKGLSAVASNGSSSEPGLPTVSRTCERVFSKLVMSGKFALLCKLLSENFQGLKIEKLLDFSLVNTRMKGGVYEHTPMLFSSDIQQVWRRLQSVGNEMASLANNLSELSRAFCHELGGATDPEASSDRKHEDPNLKWEEPGSSSFCTCKQCGEKSDGRNSLVCDSCEGMFHVSCIQPVVKEIPFKNWYCSNCTASGIESPHEDCVVCERLNSHSGVNGLADAFPTYDDDPESSDGIMETGVQVFKGSKRLTCKICQNTLRNGDEFRVCEHKYCQYKYYHTRCLSNKELKSYGPRWYCPSCLCRTCLTDKDDSGLVMCDGCDHGYHIYCMNPPRTSIPKGKWFCTRCDAGIKAIQKVRMLYENLEKEQKKSEGKKVANVSKKSKLDFEATPSGSGGMEMLLTAARTLKEEELAGFDES